MMTMGLVLDVSVVIQRLGDIEGLTQHYTFFARDGERFVD